MEKWVAGLIQELGQRASSGSGQQRLKGVNAGPTPMVCMVDIVWKGYNAGPIPMVSMVNIFRFLDIFINFGLHLAGSFFLCLFFFGFGFFLSRFSSLSIWGLGVTVKEMVAKITGRHKCTFECKDVLLDERIGNYRQKQQKHFSLDLQFFSLRVRDEVDNIKTYCLHSSHSLDDVSTFILSIRGGM